jgi:ABC-type transport system involved in multi-copper enzyme maturation permease subunit
MGGLKLIFGRDMRDLAGTSAFRIAVIIMVIMALGLAAGAMGVAASRGPVPGIARGVPAAPALIGTMLYFATFMPYLVMLWVFAGATLTREKASGHLEVLLATPLSPRSLWLAKTATMVLPGVALSLFSYILVAAGLGLVSRALPYPAAFAIPAAMALGCDLGNALLLSGLGALTVLLSFKASPDTAIVPSFILGFGLMILVPVGAAMGFIDLAAWSTASAYLGSGGLLWLFTLLAEKGLTKERIVLSSRED